MSPLPTLVAVVPNGYLAHVEGNPLTDINALFTGVRWVMKDGRVVVDR